MRTTVRRPLRRGVKTLFPAFDVLFNGFCSLNESSELPNWVKAASAVEDSGADDFVLPTTAVAAPMNDGSVTSLSNGAPFPPSKIMDTDDVDKVSNFLKKKNYTCPDAVIRALESFSIHVSNAFLDKMVKRFSNDWVPAFGFFKWAGMQFGYRHTAENYDAMVDVLGKCKQFSKMWLLVEEMVGYGGLVSLETLAKVMRRLAGAGRWIEAVETFHQIENFGVRKDTLAMNVLLDTLCKERSTEHAREVFLELRSSIPPDAHSFNILIHGWCKARRMEEARLVMKEMEECGFHPCVISYTSLVETYCSDKNFRKVNDILDEMQKKGCSPNIITYTIVMHSFGKAKLTQEALEIVEKMKKNGCKPDAPFYNSLIYILGKAGRFKHASDVFKSMSESGISPNAMTYNTMITYACEHSQEENALRLLQSMEESSCRPDIRTYTPLLKMFCRRKRMKVLHYLLRHMFDNDNSNHEVAASDKGSLCKVTAATIFKGQQPKVTMKRRGPWGQKHPLSSDDSDTESESVDEDDLGNTNSSRKNEAKSVKDAMSKASLKKKKGSNTIDYEALSRHGYSGGLSVLDMPPPREAEDKEQDWSWSTGNRDKELKDESYEERERTRTAISQGEKLVNVQTRKEQKNASFSQKEKRKRDLGQASRGKNYVEEEKRLLRDSGIYSGFDT
ncbi:hypothetical protein ACLOJK_035252 [Asimina triloba]